MDIETLHFIHPWFENTGFARVMVSTQIVFNNSAKDRWLNLTFAAGASDRKTSNSCENHIEDCKGWFGPYVHDCVVIGRPV